MSPCSSWSGETVGRLQQVHFELWSNRIREAYLTLPKCHATDKNRYKSVFIHCIISSGETVLTAYRCTGTRTHVYADYTQLNLQPTLPDSKQGLEVEEDSSGAGNMAGLLFWEKKKCLDVWLKESREGFCRRGRGRSFIVEGLKTEKAREPTVESLIRGIWRLRVSGADRRVWEGVKTWNQSVSKGLNQTVVAMACVLSDFQIAYG